jgi:hypothetical protein
MLVLPAIVTLVVPVKEISKLRQLASAVMVTV